MRKNGGYFMESSIKIRIAEVQNYLREAEIDGWLIYDFLGLNRVSHEIFTFTGHLITRRWFYFIPSQGEPTLILHKIETVNFPKVPGKVRCYAGWQELFSILKQVLEGHARVAMEYSPQNAIPTVSFVDAGTFELLKEFIPEIVSSANLIQYFTCRLNEDQLQSHKRAAQILHEAQKDAFEFIEKKLQHNEPLTEYDVQQRIMKRLHDQGFTSHSDAIVAVNDNASNPHYAPTQQNFRPIQKGDCILIDLWAKEKKPGAIYGDITWVGYAGQTPPEQYVEIWEIVREARDLAVEFLRTNHAAGKVTHGFEVDEKVRQFIDSKGYGTYFFHRTGHSIDQDDHGKGVNIDSFETRDLREIVPGLLFSIEPGIYLETFGVRTEIDVYYSEEGPQVFTPQQNELVLMNV
ncbi:MAG: aminopeptidase P family protein [Calditrichaeota bacterium]|nr:MAG: aminopeptidase P family protein [Calditrichota bacterium]